MTMIHDMSLTQRYAVVFDQPVIVDFDLAFAGRLTSSCQGPDRS